MRILALGHAFCAKDLF
jgi:hypothetical protein